MDHSKRRKLKRMGRRRFVKTALSMGIAAESLRLGTRDGIVQAADVDEMPYVKYVTGNPSSPGGREPIYDTVPREEWIRRQTAVNLRGKVEQMIRRNWGTSPITPVFVAMGESPTGFGVRVDYDTAMNRGRARRTPQPSVEEVRATLPERAAAKSGDGDFQEIRRNIPIRVVETASRNHCDDKSVVGPIQEGVYSYADSGSVPGGVPITTPKNGDTIESGEKEKIGTLAAPFHHNEYGDGWTTAGHMGAVGNWVYQADPGGARVGRIKDKVDPCCTNFLKDCAFFNDEDTGDQSRNIAVEEADGGTDFILDGYVTDNTLDLEVGTDNKYYHQGYYAGRLEGELVGTTQWGVKSTQDTTDGDSGGTLFKLSNGDAFIAGQHVGQEGPLNEDGELKCEDNSGAITAQSVQNLLNGSYMIV